MTVFLRTSPFENILASGQVSEVNSKLGVVW